MKQSKEKKMTLDKAYWKSRVFKMFAKIVIWSMTGILLAISPDVGSAAGENPSVPFEEPLKNFMRCVLPSHEYLFMRDNAFVWNIKLHYELMRANDIQTPTSTLTGCLIINKWFNAFRDKDILSDYKNVERLTSVSIKNELIRIAGYLFENSPYQQCSGDEAKYQLMERIHRQRCVAAGWAYAKKNDWKWEKSFQNYEHDPGKVERQIKRIMRESDENSRVLDSIRRNNAGP